MVYKGIDTNLQNKANAWTRRYTHKGCMWHGKGL
jgi:hypothetical protein